MVFKIYYYVLAFLAGLLVIVPLYFRGLYFEREMITAQLVVFILFLFFLIYFFLERKTFLLRSPLDYLLLIFCLVYALSISNAVVPRGAWLEFMNVVMYFVVFLLVSRLMGTRTKRWFVYALIVGAFGVAFIGIGTGFGTFDFPGAVRGERIYSILQYPNTTAALLTAGYLVSVSRMEAEDKKWVNFLLGGAAFLILVAFVFTMSRAAWLVFPGVLFLFWILNIRRFLNIFVYSLIPGILFLVLALPIWDAILESKTSGWDYLLQGMTASGVGCLLASVLFGSLDRALGNKVQYIVGFVVVALMFTGANYGASNYEAIVQRVPEEIMERIERIDYEERSVTTRLELMETAGEIIEDRPYLGAGGGGWQSLYHHYIERDYWSREVHSHPFEVGVETGYTGMVVFGLMWLGFSGQFLYILGRKRAIGQDYAQASGIFVGAIALLAHSTVDLNLSLGGVSIYLWALFGVLNYYYLTQRKDDKDDKEVDKRDIKGSWNWLKGSKEALGKAFGKIYRGINILFPYGMGIIVVALALFAGLMLSGLNEADRARELTREGELSLGEESFRRAISRDFLNYEIYGDLAKLYEVYIKDTGEDRYREKAYKTAKEGIELNPYYHPNLIELGSLILRAGYIEEGLSYLEKGYSYHKHAEAGFLTYSNGLLSAAEYYIDEGNIEPAHEYLERVISLREEFLRYHSQDSDFDINVLKAKVFLEDYQGAIELAEDEEISLPRGGERALFEALAYYGAGDKDKEKAKDMIEDSVQIIEDDDDIQVEKKKEARTKMFLDKFEKYEKELGL